MITLILLSLISIIFLWISSYQRRFWKVRGFPSDEPSFPMNALSGMGTRVHVAEKFDEYYKKHKQDRVLGTFFVFTPSLLVFDPEIIQQILVKNFQNFHDRFLYVNKHDDPLSENLASIEGENWKIRRQKFGPLFSSSKIGKIFPIVSCQADRFAEVLSQNIKTSAEQELHEMIACYTSDVIGKVAFGMDWNCLEKSDSEFRKFGRKILKIDSAVAALKWFFVLSSHKVSKWLGLMSNDKSATIFFYRNFLETLDYYEKSGVTCSHFMQTLIEMKKNDVLTKDEVASESFNFYLGGFQTTASLITFALYELAINSEVQDKLRQEILDMNNFSNDSINKLKYMDKVIKETLRKWPPIFASMRKCTEKFYIPGTLLEIPEGTNIIIPLFSLQNDEDNFPEPRKFDPERFSDENLQHIKPFTYFPFGGGPRICIGFKFSLLVTKLALTSLLKKFRFEVSPKTVVPMKLCKTSLFTDTFKEKLFLKVTQLD